MNDFDEFFDRLDKSPPKKKRRLKASVIVNSLIELKNKERAMKASIKELLETPQGKRFAGKYTKANLDSGNKYYKKVTIAIPKKENLDEDHGGSSSE